MQSLTQAQLDCIIASREGPIHPFLIRHGEITLPGLARRMAGFFRFGGDSRITVAQHCHDGAEFLLGVGAPIEARLPFLLHDGGEALTGFGDIPGPMLPGMPAVVRDLNLYAQRAVYKFFLGSEDLEATVAAMVDAMDRQMRAMEARRTYPDNWQRQFPELIDVIPPVGWEGWRGPVSPERAEREWLAAFGRLQIEWEREMGKREERMMADVGHRR
jgi:hypothetical protein